LGINYFANDFESKSAFGRFSSMDPGLSLQYTKGVNRSFDWSATIGASFPDSTRKDATNQSSKSLLLETAVSIRARVFPRYTKFQPYFSIGPGMANHKNLVSGFLQFGPGIEFNYRDIYLTTSINYKLSLSRGLNNHFSYSVGISGLLSQNKKRIHKPVQSSTVAVPQRDRDGDGILDSADLCPETPGLAKFSGCPDTDQDGIEDRLDKCPTVPGLERYQGCPIPDTDKDGLNDEADSCINIPGPWSNQGCPLPDTDKDGVPDVQDKCPDKAGLKENNGCPTIEVTIQQINSYARSIWFETGSSELNMDSKQSLDQIYQILQEQPRLYLNIEGHTDNIGTHESNLLLSRNRARAVELYLVNKGIAQDRLKSMGFGQTRPVVDNTTKEGRAKNRRVEFVLMSQK
jgi:outer membrane protein OmpA-like peptidoglycan-associated protein